MANVKISALPSYTGTAADLRWFVMNNSGETETFKYSGYTSPYKRVGTNNTNNTYDTNAMGGTFSSIVGGSGNTISATLASNGMMGGKGNTIAGTAEESNIIGGRNNTLTNKFGNTIIGGLDNTLTSTSNDGSQVIAGSEICVINADRGNGIYNSYDTQINGASYRSVALGSIFTRITNGSGTFSLGSWITIGGSSAYGGAVGGVQHTMNSSTSSVFVGGNQNTITSSNNSIIAGGESDVINLSPYSSILTSKSSQIVSSEKSSILGGEGNYILTGFNSTILGGIFNVISDSNYANISGGRENVITGGTNYSTITGGLQNRNEGNYSTIVGGQQNYIKNPATEYSTIINAYSSTTEGDNSHIFGGLVNEINSGQAIIFGGRENIIAAGSDNSEMLGCRNSVISGSSVDTTLINTISGNTNGFDRLVMVGTSGRTATRSDATFVENLVVFNYAGLNFADDTAAAAGGVVLGQIYHTGGLMKIRIV